MRAVTVVGGGFAGVEAAWALARSGVKVRLVEMRPRSSTPAHTTSWLAELVCSNSFKSDLPDTPAGRLKEEMRALGSLVLEVAERHQVPGGEALCVDRDEFASEVTRRLESHPLIEVVRSEFLPEDLEEALREGRLVVLATGPLTSEPLSAWLAERTGRRHLHFYDAVSPTVEASSIDRSVAFYASRYGKGGDDYLNCPFDKESYFAFVRELTLAERAPIHAFEAGGRRDAPAAVTNRCDAEHPAESDKFTGSPPEHPRPAAPSFSRPEGSGRQGEGEFLERVRYFAGCTPIEAIAEGGEMSLAFGNFKPVGLTDPRTGKRPFAVLQLRPENRERTLYSLVGCQTRLRWGDQKRVFRMVPGLARAEFVRFGVIHRNTYLDAPRVLLPDLRLRAAPSVFVAGQLTGVEGYIESAAMGILAGLHVARMAVGLEPVHPPRETAYGSLLSHLSDDTDREFAPMNMNWGLFPQPEGCPRDKGQVRAAKIESAAVGLRRWLRELGERSVLVRRSS
jgi:methylenetetrahydrofolate--tRNA-(uracil-5-)-methyltransferase